MADKAPENVAEAAEQKKAQAEAAAAAKAEAVKDKVALHVALNKIVQIGADGKEEVVEPGIAFYPAKADIDHLRRYEAVREATEAERVMQEHIDKMRAEASVNEALG